MEPLSEFLKDRRGSIAVMSAAACTLLCLAAAMAVDLGAIQLRARQVQGAADLAALAAVRDLPRAEAAARATAHDNLGGTAVVQAQTGRFTADRSLAPGARFATGGVAAPNAARATVTSTSRLYFGRWILGRDEVTVTRSATAAVLAEPRTAFTIGSRLARLDAGIANQVLSSLAGSSVNLSLMDYRALADADVNLLQFSDALATHLGVTAGDYNALYSQEIDAGQALRVLEGLMGGSGSGAVGRIAQAVSGRTLNLGELVGIQTGSRTGTASALNASVSALDLASAVLETAGGDRQLSLNAGAQPLLADLRVSVAIGERPNQSPWLTVTDHGEPIISTAQARLYLRARTTQQAAGLAQVEAPVLVELAGSQARLNTQTCRPTRSVELGVRPGLARVTIGTIDESRLSDFTRPLSPSPATLLSVAGLVTVTGKADAEAADTGFTRVTFSEAAIQAGETKTVATSQVAGSLISTAIGRLDLKVNVIGLGIGLGGLKPAIQALLTPLGPVLDAVVNPVLFTLGLKLGEADVTVVNAICPDGRVALVG